MISILTALLTAGICFALGPAPAPTAASDSAPAVEPCHSYLTALRLFGEVDPSRPFPNENGGLEEWPVDGEHRAPHDHGVRYNAYFAPTLGYASLEHLAFERRATGRTAHVLDLFGSAVFSPSPHAFSSLTGVRRYAYDDRRLTARYRPAAGRGPDHRVELAGDLVRPTTWRRLDERSRRRGIAAFDVILVRPIGPKFTVTSELLRAGAGLTKRRVFYAFAHAFVNRAWRRLSSDGGHLLLEINLHVKNSPEFNRWLASLRTAGIKYVFGRAGGDMSEVHSVLHLRRWPGSPRRLP